MRHRIWGMVLVAGVAAGCAESDGGALEPELTVLPVFNHVDGAAHDARNFRTHATGREEVPPNASRAQGQAQFKLSADGTSLAYRLIVANIQNVTQAHIHLAPAGTNGPVVVWLYPSGPPPQLIAGRTQGVLATGTITVDDLVGPLAGEDFDVLLAAMRAGNTYVNVHTMQLPPGEIRGQID